MSCQLPFRPGLTLTLMAVSQAQDHGRPLRALQHLLLGLALALSSVSLGEAQEDIFSYVTRIDDSSFVVGWGTFESFGDSSPPSAPRVSF